MVSNDVNDANIFIQKALDDTTQELLIKLREIIEEVVYSYDDTWTNGWNGEQGRTGQFKDSWEKSSAVIMDNIAESEIFQNYMTMKYEEPFSHGSAYGDGELMENALNEIIMNGYHDTDIGFPEMKPRPFWSKFQDYVDSNLSTIFAKNMQKNGLPIGVTHNWG